MIKIYMLLDLLFPKFCINCKKWGAYVCLNCRAEIEVLSFYICPVCNDLVYPTMIHQKCKEKSPVSGVMCVMKYKGVVKKLVKSIKYHLVYDIYKELTDFVIKSSILAEFADIYSDCYLQAIPLHPNRFKLRGFNQAEELAKIFSKQFHYPVIHSISRIKNTIPQAQIRIKKDRQENIKNSFITTTPNYIQGKNIILVDDVYTSGSTCLEAAKTLVSAGAKQVFVWTLARD